MRKVLALLICGTVVSGVAAYVASARMAPSTIAIADR